MNSLDLSPVPAVEPEFFYGRSLIYTIRRHGAGESAFEASKAAELSAEKARLTASR